MKYAIQDSQGFQVTEVLRINSKNDSLKIAADINGLWSNSALKNIPEATGMRYLTELGKVFTKAYNKKIEAWKTSVRAELNKSEKYFEQKISEFDKLAEKKKHSPKISDQFVKQLNERQTKAVNEITANAETSYVKMVEGMIQQVIDQTKRSTDKDTQTLLKRGKASMAWKAVRFVAATTALTVAAVAVAATGGTAAAVGLATVVLVFKGLSTIKDLGEGCVKFRKAYEAEMVKVDQGVTLATATIDTAISNMRIAQKNRDLLEVERALVIDKMEKAQKDAKGDKSNSELKQAMDKVKKVQDSIESFEKKIGGKPNEILPALETARKSLNDANAMMPDGMKSGNSSSAMTKIFEKLAEVVDEISNWIP